MTEGLTKKIAYEELQKFFSDKPFVIFETDPSIAVNDNLGMVKLKEFLCEKIPEENLEVPPKNEWDKVT